MENVDYIKCKLISVTGLNQKYTFWGSMKTEEKKTCRNWKHNEINWNFLSCNENTYLRNLIKVVILKSENRNGLNDNYDKNCCDCEDSIFSEKPTTEIMIWLIRNSLLNCTVRNKRFLWIWLVNISPNEQRYYSRHLRKMDKDIWSTRPPENLFPLTIVNSFPSHD